MTALHPYMVWASDPWEGAVLAFAPNARVARKVGFPLVSHWCEAEWIDIRSRRLRSHEAYLLTIADPAKLYAGKPHALDDVPSCAVCGLWGSPPFQDRPGCIGCGGVDGEDAE